MIIIDGLVSGVWCLEQDRPAGDLRMFCCVLQRPVKVSLVSGTKLLQHDEWQAGDTNFQELVQGLVLDSQNGILDIPADAPLVTQVVRRKVTGQVARQGLVL